MPVRPAFRLARGVVFATVCVALATTGHVMASHVAVPPVAVAGGLAVLVAVAVALAGTERSLATILAGLTGGQFMLHVLFIAAQHGQYPTHAHLARPVASGGGGGMVLAHLVAAVVSAWWLRRGERAVWALARKVAAAVGRPARALLARYSPPSPRPRPVAGAAPGSRRGGAVLRHVVIRRGPPSPSTALA
jgi:hypothetical protein